MKFHAECIPCLMELRLRNTFEQDNARKRLAFAQGLCRIAEAADPDRDTAPGIGRDMLLLQREIYGQGDDYRAERSAFNALMMDMYGDIREHVLADADPLQRALCFALAGNYIDSAVVGNVRREELLGMLQRASASALDARESAAFAKELAGRGAFVLLHDNCGEIVLDKLLLEVIHGLYPQKRLVSIVRGGEIFNDATREDALEVGIDEFAELRDNNMTDFGGTCLEEMDPETRRIVEGADLILAKGMGNFETLVGCGLNVYYLFLSKCVNYKKWFGFNHMTPVLANDRRMHID